MVLYKHIITSDLHIRSDDEEPAEQAEGAEEQTHVAPKRSAWARPGAKKAHKGAGLKNKYKGSKSKQPVAVKQDTKASAQQQQEKQSTKDKDESDAADTDGNGADSDNENDKNDAGSDRSSDDEKKSSVEDDDEEWEKFQQKLNKREKLEGKSKISHSVHCPYFPEDKQEYWWTYICDRKSRTLLTAPYHVTNLVEREEVQLKFTAPRWPGVYTFAVCLRSGKASNSLTPQNVLRFIFKFTLRTDFSFSAFFAINRFIRRNGSAARVEIRCERGASSTNRSPTMGH